MSNRFMTLADQVPVPISKCEIEVHPHVAAERAELFTCPSVDSGSTEQEYLELLKALVRVTKPNRCLETGTHRGWGTRAICEALELNGFGTLDSVDLSLAVYGRDHGSGYRGMAAKPNLIQANSLVYLRSKPEPYDFAFLDSDLPTRAEEFAEGVALGVFPKGCVVAIHDTSPLRTTGGGVPDPQTAQFYERMTPLSHLWECGFAFPLSRGMLLLRVK